MLLIYLLLRHDETNMDLFAFVLYDAYNFIWFFQLTDSVYHLVSSNEEVT